MLNAGYRVRGTTRSRETHDTVRATLGAQADIGRLELVEADLLGDEGWQAAVAGCDAVLHLASPFPSKQPKDENVLIRPAVEGSLRVLRAAAAAGVQRFVQTSSTVAVMYGHPRERTAPFTEDDWTTPCGTGCHCLRQVEDAGRTRGPRIHRRRPFRNALCVGQSWLRARAGARP